MFEQKSLNSIGTLSIVVPKGQLLINTGAELVSFETGAVGRREDFSLFFFSSIKIGFWAIEPASKLLNAKQVKAVSVPGWNTASMSKSGSSLWSSTAIISETGYSFVSMSCAPTLQSTSSRISIIPCWMGLIGARTSGLLQKICLWDNNKLQAGRVFSWELIVISWTRSFTVRITEYDSKSRDHSKFSLETETSYNVLLQTESA